MCAVYKPDFASFNSRTIISSSVFTGNLCALGGMDPVIQVWDLDIENCLEPAFKLGKKPNKKKKTKRVGHKEAVLDLSWNRNFTHVMASGSADNTVLLWDLDQGTPHTKLDYFEDKVSIFSVFVISYAFDDNLPDFTVIDLVICKNETTF